MKDFRIAVVALNPDVDDPDRNVDRITMWAERAKKKGARLVLFPEGVVPGYLTRKLEAVAVPLNSPQVRRIRAAAEQIGIVICFGLMERRGADVHVSQVTVGPGLFLCYRKCHMTDGEKPVCTPGTRIVPQDLGFVKMGIQICYDSAFPRATETLVRRGAELIVTPSCHGSLKPAKTVSAQRTELVKRRIHIGKYWRARAYDYSTYAIYLNNSGWIRGEGWFPGYAAVFGPDGETVAETMSVRESMITADLDASFQSRCRRNWIGHYRSLPDARPDLYA